MMAADIPPALQERVVCSIAAATKYGIPANILLAVAQREGGRPGQWVRNRNATYDIGAMQFNTSYIRTLSRYGIGTADVAKPGCFSYDLAAWRIRGHIKNDRGDIWTRVSNYHSRTPVYNVRYRAGIIANARYWANWLSTRFNTYDALAGTPSAIVKAGSAVAVTKAPVVASTPNSASSPIRTARARSTPIINSPGRTDEVSPYVAPIGVPFQPPGYVPRTITPASN